MSTFEPFKTKTHMGGPQRLYRFENGYGASVVQNMYSRGTEMAVIKWSGNDFRLVYDTPITDDVINYMDEDEVQETLRRISSLTTDGQEPPPTPSGVGS
jgi:hypothetical protein